MNKKNPMPTPVKKALSQLSGKVKAQVAIVMKEEGYRFTTLPDRARQAIRDAVINDLKQNTYVSMTACAVAYGVTAPNVHKWKIENRNGITKIGARGRKEGIKNQFNHKIDPETGKEILVPFKPRQKIRRSVLF